MQFAQWLNESAQIIRSHLDTYQVVDLGTIGWWRVYSTVKTTRPPGKVLSLQEYQSGNYLPDPWIKNLSQLHNILNESVKRLSYLGFRQMRTNLIITDLTDKTNHITGVPSGVAGSAHRKEHGIVVSKKVDINTVVHEHAHMIWFQLPKPNKEFFQNYFRKNVLGFKPSLEQVWKLSDVRGDKNKLIETIKTFGWESFRDNLQHTLKSSFETYFNVNNAQNKSDIIRDAVLYNFGTFCPAILKVDLNFQAISGWGGQMVSAGTRILVERATRYILVYYTDPKIGRKIEYPKPIEKEQLDQFVEFREDLLEGHYLETFQRNYEAAKNPVQWWAGKKHVDFINEAFKKATESIASSYRITQRGGTQYRAEQLFSPRFNYYTSWVSMIGRRVKADKIKSVDDFKQVFTEVMLKAARLFDHNTMPGKMVPWEFDNSRVEADKLEKPEGKGLRNLIAQAGLTPSDYAASNVHELWAVTVEMAAEDLQSITPELRKLIYATINGF